MAGKNKFGFAPIDEADLSKSRKRDVGPMGAAVRDAAGNLSESTETLVEQRRQNATDAKEFRAAVTEGRVLSTLALADIRTDDLPRDRIDLDQVSGSDEMEELKASIKVRGQKEPIEVYRGADGALQLKKGWRRLTALRQLWEETGDTAFATIVARVAETDASRLDLYVDMVEENVIRQDLTFAEMAQVAITAAADSDLDDGDASALVARLYGSLHKMKRSYIKSFVFLLEAIGADLAFPKSISRNLGVNVARKIKERGGVDDALRVNLRACESAEAEREVLEKYLTASTVELTDPKPRAAVRSPKMEIHVGEMKVTTRGGECRIISRRDFSTIDQAVLERAVRAFEASLLKG